MDSKYHVGDKVRIVDGRLSPEEMDEFAGTIQEVKSVQWCDICGRYEYRIKNSLLLWGDDDFEFDAQTELPEFNASELSLKDLFN
jgi:hypothetical protein